MFGVVLALVVTTAVMVNLPARNIYAALAWVVGLIVWFVEYLIILNKVEYPLVQRFLNNA